MRIPFSIGEEILHFADRPAEPLTIHLELRLSGALDEGLLRESIRAAVMTHPMARAKKTGGRVLHRPPLWEIGEPGLVDVLRVARCDDEPAMAAARTEFLSRPVGVVTAPALRVLLARRPGGDSLLLSVNHAIADGIGAFRFLQSVARAYGGRPDPVPEVDPLAARDLKAQFGGAQARPRETERPDRTVGAPSLVAPRGDRDASGYGSCHRALPAEQSRRLKPRRFGPTATPNDLLVAAMHLAIAAWNAEQGRPCGRLSVLVPVNLRPPAWHREVMANLVMSGQVSSTPEQRSTPESLLAAVTSQTQRIKAGGRTAAILALPGFVYRQIPLLLGVLSVLPSKGEPNAAVLSYVGRVDDVADFGPAVGEPTEFWASPPVRMPTGIALGVCRLRGSLRLALRYRRALLDDQAAERLADLFLDRLASLGEGEPRPVEPGEASGPSRLERVGV
jgi:NRPS condensation-like uncharacterized protein